ncbi:MAG: hypothetical protein DMF92_22240 [Acidobacteria bacterium]|nr:MAG: hypothetical protein DMF92_22240 [Acidobacteriota bacterium]
MMVLPIYTHDQGAGFESVGSDRRSRQHLIRRLILQFACCQLVMFIRVMYLSGLAPVNGLLARR